MELELLKKLDFWFITIQLVLLALGFYGLWLERKAREDAEDANDPLGHLYVVPNGSVVLVEVKPGMHKEARELMVDYCQKHFDRAFTFVPIVGRPEGGGVWAIKPKGISDVLRPAEELGDGQQDPKESTQGAKAIPQEKAP